MRSTIISELLRISTSPYAISLKSLSDALIQNKSHYLSDLSDFAERYPCQITSLSHALINALEYCPFAQQVFEKLAQERKIRDGIVRSRKNILDVLLKSALGNDRGWGRYSSMCLALLSTQLPKDIPPPALLAKFFLRWVEVFTTTGVNEGVKEEAVLAIYILVKAGHGGLLECLSLQQRNMLFGRLKKHVVSTGQKMTLLSLATLGMLNEIGVRQGERADDDQETETIITADDLFNGSKTERMLQLVCLNVKSAASREVAGGDLVEAREIVELARKIARVTDKEKREYYLKSEERKQLLRDSVVRADGIVGDKEVFKEVVGFVMEITNGKGVNGMMDVIYQHLRNELGEVRFKDVAVLKIVPGCIGEILVKNCPPDIIRDFLLSAICLSSKPLPSDFTTFCRLMYHISFLQAITLQVPTSRSLRITILSCLMTNEFSKPLEAFTTSTGTLPSPSKSDYCSKGQVCLTHLWNLQRELSSNLCTLLLTAGIYSNCSESSSPEENDGGNFNFIQIDSSLATTLLHLHGKLSSSISVHNPCPYEPSQFLKDHNPSTTSLPTITFLEQSCTPSTRLTSHSWRQRILSELQTNASRQHQSLISAMGEICRDLETRCETIEKPLQDEKERVTHLTKELENTKNKIKELDELLDSRNTMIQELHATKDHIEVQLDVALEKVQDAEGRCEELEEELEIEKEKRKEEKEVAKFEADRIAGEHLGILTERIERIAELEENKTALEKEVIELKREIDEIREELEGVTRDKIKSDDRTVWLDGELSGALAMVYEKKEENDNLLKELKQRDETIKELQSEIINKDSMILTKERTILEIKQVIEQKEEKIISLSTKLDSLSANLTQELQTTHSLTTNLSALTTTNTNLQNTITHLEYSLEQIKESSSKHLNFLQSNTTSQHEAIISHLTALQETFSQSKESWDREREKLEKEVGIWERKYTRLRILQEKKDEEVRSAEELSRRLMSAIQAVGLGSVGAGAGDVGGMDDYDSDNGEDREIIRRGSSSLPSLKRRRVKVNEPVVDLLPPVPAHRQSRNKDGELSNILEKNPKVDSRTNSYPMHDQQRGREQENQQEQEEAKTPPKRRKSSHPPPPPLRPFSTISNNTNKKQGSISTNRTTTDTFTPLTKTKSLKGKAHKRSTLSTHAGITILNPSPITAPHAPPNITHADHVKIPNSKAPSKTPLAISTASTYKSKNENINNKENILPQTHRHHHHHQLSAPPPPTIPPDTCPVNPLSSPMTTMHPTSEDITLSLLPTYTSTPKNYLHEEQRINTYDVTTSNSAGDIGLSIDAHNNEKVVFIESLTHKEEEGKQSDYYEDNEFGKSTSTTRDRDIGIESSSQGLAAGEEETTMDFEL